MFGIFDKKEAENTVSKKGKTNAPVNEPKGRKLEGVVVSDKMQKTVVVKVSHEKKNAKYLKYFTSSSRFKAHDETNQYHTGDKVVIQETRPLSKYKRWIVISKIS